MREAHARKKKRKQHQRTKLFPFETSHPLRSELKDFALENIPLYKDIDLHTEQAMNKKPMIENCSYWHSLPNNPNPHIIIKLPFLI